MRAAYQLRDQFASTSSDSGVAAELASASPRQSSAVAWCLLDQDTVRARAARHSPEEYGRRRAWTVGLHVGAVISDADEFVDLICAAVTRTAPTRLGHAGSVQRGNYTSPVAGNRITQLYDRRQDEISLDEVERIRV